MRAGVATDAAGTAADVGASAAAEAAATLTAVGSSAAAIVDAIEACILNHARHTYMPSHLALASTGREDASDMHTHENVCAYN